MILYNKDSDNLCTSFSHWWNSQESGVSVCGLQILPRFSPCKTLLERWLNLQDLILRFKVKTCFDCKMFDVTNWVACLNGENGPGGTPLHEALSVSPQGALEISSVIGHPSSETISAHLEWWRNPANMMKGADLHPKTTVSESLQTPQTKAGALTKSVGKVSLKQTRRNPLGRVLHSPVENHDLVPSLAGNPNSQTHSRVSECV